MSSDRLRRVQLSKESAKAKTAKYALEQKYRNTEISNTRISNLEESSKIFIGEWCLGYDKEGDPSGQKKKTHYQVGFVLHFAKKFGGDLGNGIEYDANSVE